MTYSEKLQDPRWQKVRLQVLKRDKWKCKCCGEDKITLHVHHQFYSANPWDAYLNDLKTLCKNCHTIVEQAKKNKCEIFNLIKIDLINDLKMHCAYLKDEDEDIHIILYKTQKNGDLEFYQSYSGDILEIIFKGLSKTCKHL